MENSWTYNTALIILPFLAEYEVLQLLKRAQGRKPQYWFREGMMVSDSLHGPPDSSMTKESVGSLTRWHQKFEEACKGFIDCETLDPMSERTCRRLRILLEYLTYKGRGIPRKILREFYGMVQNSTIVPSPDPGHRKLGNKRKDVTAGVAMSKPAVTNDEEHWIKYVLAFPQHHIQKMNFYAGIVEYLDLAFVELRGLNDKGRVALFHILDYLLKFYTTGFSLRDVEHANFMTTRQEFFPSRQLANLLIRLMDGKLWKRKDSRSPDYRLLHYVVHDLGVMFLRYGPEQMELRHTYTDFKEELRQLETSLSKVDGSHPDQRLEPVHAQIRKGKILEMIGNHFDARVAYNKALRWLCMDVDLFEGRPGQGRMLTEGFVLPVAAAMIEALLAVGRLHEGVAEYRSALRAYQEAEKIHERVRSQRTPSDRPSAGSQVRRSKLTPAEERAVNTRASHLVHTLTQADLIQPSDMDVIKSVIWPKPAVSPIKLDNCPGGLVDVFNHQAVAYSKLWESANANASLMKALSFLHEEGDEYGVIDQMFLIGQFMTRRRDFRAAALWYGEAMRKIAAIRNHSEIPSRQSGADWQTPGMGSNTQAAILAALGDICYATAGQALLSKEEIRGALADGLREVQPLLLKPKGKLSDNDLKICRSFVARKIRHRADEAIGRMAQETFIDVYEDRPIEFFQTAARYYYQSAGDPISASDVYLRQLEMRVDRFRRLVGYEAIPGDKPDFSKGDRYSVLNSWASFWKGARVMLHRQLTIVSGLVRDTEEEWGRITDFRRMGTLLRLVGEMLREFALAGSDSKEAQLFCKQSIANKEALLKAGGAEEKPMDGFYREFCVVPDPCQNPGDSYAALSPEDVKSIVDQRASRFTKEEQVKIIREAKTTEVEKVEWILLRVGVNQAARDIRTIFAYVSDRFELEREGEQPDEVKLEYVGARSSLRRLNGNVGTSPEEDGLPIAKVLSWMSSAKAQPEQKEQHSRESAVKNFRLLALAEKSCIAAYACHRDAIPDYNFAMTLLSVGELYITATKELCSRGEMLPLEDEQLCTAINYFTSYAKRFVMRAIDVLRRERDQNRNTFHLMSEAQFNLGDLLLIRLAALSGNEIPNDGMFPSTFTKLDKNNFIPGFEERLTHSMDGDWVAEDLRRQIWDAYHRGLVLVQNEMDDYLGRFRFPAEVYHNQRNVMDAALHFRICRAARLRHVGEPIDGMLLENPPTEENYGFDSAKFAKLWDSLSREVASFESPQRPMERWLPSFRALFARAQEVRSDRSPLGFKEVGGIYKLHWNTVDQMRQIPRLTIFGEVTTLNPDKKKSTQAPKTRKKPASAQNA